MKKGNIKGSTLHVGGHFVEIPWKGINKGRDQLYNARLFLWGALTILGRYVPYRVSIKRNEEK